MSLENWVKNSWLEKRASDREEIGRLVALADGRLEDYQRAVTGKLSADVQLGLAYDAIRISATAALRAAGYRVVRGGSEHYRTIEALEFSIDPQKKLIPTLNKLRKKRNIGSYDDYGLVSQGEADHCGKIAVRDVLAVELADTTRRTSAGPTFGERRKQTLQTYPPSTPNSCYLEFGSDRKGQKEDLQARLLAHLELDDPAL